MPHQFAPIIVMGVQGSGKSTVGALLAAALGVPFVDGDDLHSPTAIEKMAAGTPLTDEDRAPWLRRVGQYAATSREAGTPVVIACSALKVMYRDMLRELVPDFYFVHLEGGQELIAQRLSTRNHEYMPAGLLNSQFETLEPLTAHESGIVVDVTDGPEEVVAQVVAALTSGS